MESGEEITEYLVQHRNWGRWGDDDERGTVNLIDAEKVLSAVGLVRSARKVSLARPFPIDTGPHNAQPALQWWTRKDVEYGGGHAGDWIGVFAHGLQVTHLDAVAHMWDADGMYNGRSPESLGFKGLTFGGIENWSDGIITRGVLLNVPEYRGTDYVTQESPVHGWELEEILKQKNITLSPGDAICVFSGREAWQEANPEKPYGAWKGLSGRFEYPGLHASCIPFLREHDVGMLVWDMLDQQPDAHEFGITSTIHSTIYAFGLALLDNALLEPLARACAEEGRSEFLLVAIPLLLGGGTGSPINPVAVF